MLGETNSLAGRIETIPMTYQMLKDGEYSYNYLSQYTYERLKTKIPAKPQNEREEN